MRIEIKSPDRQTRLFRKRFICAAMLLSCMGAMPITASADVPVKLGDYVQMGMYYGEPILWRCVDIDENGMLMLSDKILCIKAFDAKGGINTLTGSHSREFDRQLYGSNYWADSNMRSWLNSTASEGDVQWLCGNPPDKDHLWKGYDEYDQEAGFLSNFTQQERNAIKEMSQKSLLPSPEIDEGMAVTGEEWHEWYSDMNTVVANFDAAYAEYLTDQMFLPDVKQINAVYNNSDILGEDYYIGEPTEQCVANSEYKNEEYLKPGEKWDYWLRTPCSHAHSDVRIVPSGGGVTHDNAYAYDSGVRPAFYLNSATEFLSGDGQKETPYSFNEPTPTPTPTLTPTPTPAPEPSDRVEFEWTGSTVSANVIFEKTTPPNEEDIRLYVVYMNNGELKRIEMPKIIDMSADFVVPEECEEYEISVYVWDKDMKPLMNIQRASK